MLYIRSSFSASSFEGSRFDISYLAFSSFPKYAYETTFYLLMVGVILDIKSILPRVLLSLSASVAMLSDSKPSFDLYAD